MAYIGKSPSTKFSAAAKIDTFTGDGSTVAFDLANIIPAGGENGLQVFVNNVRQKPGASNAFTVGNDGSGDLKRITFTAAPDASDEIYVITTFEATNITEVGDGTITSAKIADGTVANADVSPSAGIVDTKLATITTASKVNVSALSAPGCAGVFLRGDRTYGAIPTDDIDTNAFNISLLGFKMAVNEGLTVFNLVDGIVDEFHDESGTDEAEGSNDTYCATSDYYINATSPTGTTQTLSAGYSISSTTEPDTGTAGTNPTYGSGTIGEYTVQPGMASVNVYVWGAGGGGSSYPPQTLITKGGGGGYAAGTLAVTAGQVFDISVGEGGRSTPQDVSEGIADSHGGGGFSSPTARAGTGGGHSGYASYSDNVDSSGASGGGLSGIFTNNTTFPSATAPAAFVVAGSGGGGGYNGGSEAGRTGGAGGGTTGDRGGQTTEQTGNGSTGAGGGGDQEQGGQGGSSGGEGGSLFTGGRGNYPNCGGGGAGYYGGGGGGPNPEPRAGGGGSSFHGHPQITSGSTEEGAGTVGGGTGVPLYVAGTNEGGSGSIPYSQTDAEDGYVLITGTSPSTTLSTTIVSNAFTATSVPTTSRIVVFEENVASPTLNTDIIASISRDGGSNFTTATLSDSGYVTGSSGQRILTGQATISGQPSGQSMRWKLALANNAVKIHGVSLQWS